MTDLLCLDDLDQFGIELDDPLAELAQDNYHRLIESPGSNPDDPDRGLGLDDLLSAAIGVPKVDQRDAVDLTLLGARIESELLKDSRNADVRATLSVVDAGHTGTSIAVDVEIVTDDGELTGLGLTVGADGVTRRA